MYVHFFYGAPCSYEQEASAVEEDEEMEREDERELDLPGS
jgi:hypothetical protein